MEIIAEFEDIEQYYKKVSKIRELILADHFSGNNIYKRLKDRMFNLRTIRQVRTMIKDQSQ